MIKEKLFEAGEIIYLSLAIVYYKLLILLEKTKHNLWYMKQAAPYAVDVPTMSFMVLSSRILWGTDQGVREMYVAHLNEAYSKVLKEEALKKKDMEYNKALIDQTFQLLTVGIFLFPSLRESVLEESKKTVHRKLKWDLAVVY